MDCFYPPVRFTLKLGYRFRNNAIYGKCEAFIQGDYLSFKPNIIACIIQCYCPAVADTLALLKVIVSEKRVQLWVAFLVHLYPHFAVNFSSTHQWDDHLVLHYEGRDFRPFFKMKTFVFWPQLFRRF